MQFLHVAVVRDCIFVASNKPPLCMQQWTHPPVRMQPHHVRTLSPMPMRACPPVASPIVCMFWPQGPRCQPISLPITTTSLRLTRLCPRRRQSLLFLLPHSPTVAGAGRPSPMEVVDLLRPVSSTADRLTPLLLPLAFPRCAQPLRAAGVARLRGSAMARPQRRDGLA
jgi:hypothetical protein